MFEDKFQFQFYIYDGAVFFIFLYFKSVYLYVQYNILAVKNICKNKTFVLHNNIFLFKSLCRLTGEPVAECSL